MSMTHKGFLFDYENFSSQFRNTLIVSLVKDNREILINFIEQHIKEIKDPYEGVPLENSWQTMIEDEDIQEYADFALTKFYEPSEDIGLGYEWKHTEEILNKEFLINSRSIILGERIGFSDSYFNPGRIGSYFQSFAQVQKNLKNVQKYLERRPEFLVALQNLILMLQSAKNAQKGLYITF